MKTISEQAFLTWADEAGLVPDPAYPHSCQQLVFTSASDCWAAGASPRGTHELAAWLRHALRSSLATIRFASDCAEVASQVPQPRVIFRNAMAAAGYRQPDEE
jgi:hypothetical protein